MTRNLRFELDWNNEGIVIVPTLVVHVMRRRGTDEVPYARQPWVSITVSLLVMRKALRLTYYRWEIGATR